MRRRLGAFCLVLLAGPAAPAGAACVSAGSVASLEEIVERLVVEGRRYVFVGERHGVGPAKRFAVDLANALVERGHDVGLYVEGFRTDCPPRDRACRHLARDFNAEAFERLLAESKAPVHAIDPPERRRRAARMAEAVAAGGEAIRIVLLGRSHVVFAGDPEAELWVYGGGLRYPDPGDVVEAFPPEQVLTLALETDGAVVEPYSVRVDGCLADYSLATPDTGAY